MWWSQRGRRRQYDDALHAGLVRLHVLEQRPASVHPRAHTHVTFIAFPRQQWFPERILVLRHMYVACLVPIFRCFLITYQRFVLLDNIRTVTKRVLLSCSLQCDIYFEASTRAWRLTPDGRDCVGYKIVTRVAELFESRTLYETWLPVFPSVCVNR
jgi:hypothetical protein